MNRRKGTHFASGGNCCPSSLLGSIFILGAAFLCLLAPTMVRAQNAGTLNVGVQVGRPSGATLKLYRSPHTVYTGLFTTEGNHRAELHMTRLHERPLPDSLVRGYVGGGAMIGATRLNRAPKGVLGITGQLGLNFYSSRFEVFLHATPILRVLPRVKPVIGGSVGLRYMIHQP